MKRVRNVGVGFLLSFIGSIPLGYLNVVGLTIYSRSGCSNLVFFLMGVVFVESFVVYFSILFAKELLRSTFLMKVLDCFSIGFMFLLAYVFYSSFNPSLKAEDKFGEYLKYSPFVVGVILNCFNFMQLPFWLSWNLYLLNGKYIRVEKELKYYYIAGTLVGVFLGMFSLIVILQHFFQRTSLFSKYVMPVFIPIFFIVLGSVQVFKVYKKYYKSAALDE